ncbi:MAG: DMT family transporter [Alphaproteobacteria bacterium]|nr:DMT family transporter [Alphaproteobacteria bacterium]
MRASPSPATTDALLAPLDPATAVEGQVRRGMMLMGVSLLLLFIGNTLARELSARLPVGEVVFFRFAGAFVVTMSLWIGVGAPALSARRLPLHALRALLVVGATFALYASTRHLPFADLIAIAYSAPLFVVLLAWPVIGERVGRRRAIISAVGFFGVLLVAFPGQFKIWSLGALAMAVLNSGATLCTRSLARSEDATTIAFCFAAFGMLFSMPVILIDWIAPDPFEFALLAVLGIVSGLSIHVHALAFRLAPASVLAPVDYVGVLLSVGIGFVLWSETPSAFMLVGGAVIVATGILLFRDPR